MQRRGFVAWTSAALAAGFSLDLRQARALAQGVAEEPTQEASIFGGPPVLQSPAASDGGDGVPGRARHLDGWVEYGLTSTALDQRADAMRHGLLPLNGLVHRVRLDGPEARHRPITTASASRPIGFRGAYKITRGIRPVHAHPFTFRTLDSRTAVRRASSSSTTRTRTWTRCAGRGRRLAAARRRHAQGVAAGRAGRLFWNGDIFNDVRSDAADRRQHPHASDRRGRAGREAGLRIQARDVLRERQPRRARHPCPFARHVRRHPGRCCGTRSFAMGRSRSSCWTRARTSRTIAGIRGPGRVRRVSRVAAGVARRRR
jgi:hypothetical protein